MRGFTIYDLRFTRLAIVWLVAGVLCGACGARGASYPIPPATQAQVNAGVDTLHAVTPATLAGWGGGGGGITASTATNIALYESDITNKGVGTVWANDLGFSPTNTAAGNSNALNLAILLCSNLGGGIICYGGSGTGGAGLVQTIQLSGEHMFPPVSGGRIKLQGDCSTIIHYTGGATTNAVLFGCFDAEGVNLSGPGTNAADVYPYTNCVGFYDGFLYDPRIEDCHVTGFGQGLVFGYTGAIRGTFTTHCLFDLNDIGVAMANEADQSIFIANGVRGNRIGYDWPTVTPSTITNIPIFAFATGQVGNPSSTSGGNDVYIKGGIDDYNRVAYIICGKGHLTVDGSYSGFEGGGNYLLISPHPSFLPVSFPSDGGAEITLSKVYAFEAGLTTNIWLPGSGGAGIASLELHHCAIGTGSGYGILCAEGPSHVFFDEGTFFGNANSFLPDGVGALAYSDAQTVDYHNAQSTRNVCENGVSGQSLSIDDFSSGYTDNLILKSWGQIDGGGVDRFRFTFKGSAANVGRFFLSNIGLSLTNDEALGTNAVITPAMFAVSNGAPVIVVSNFAAVNGTLYTNLSGARVAVRQGIILVAGASTASAVSSICNFNITNGGVGFTDPWEVSNSAPFTNQLDCTEQFTLGPGDTFRISEAAVGAQSSCTLSGNMIWKLQ